MTIDKSPYSIANLRHSPDTCCVWECCKCGAENVEYAPYPLNAICSECDHEEGHYCKHAPVAIAEEDEMERARR